MSIFLHTELFDQTNIEISSAAFAYKRRRVYVNTVRAHNHLIFGLINILTTFMHQNTNNKPASQEQT